MVHRFGFLFFLVCALTITPGVPEVKAQDGLPRYRPGELLVQFKANHRAASLAEYQQNHRVLTRGVLGQGHIQHLELPSSLSVTQALALYRKDPNVLLVEPNYYLEAQTLPDDPEFEHQWALANTGQVVSGYVGTPGIDIDALDAWQITDGRPEVIVAVVDTGVAYTHPEIAAAIWTNPGEIADNGIDDDHNGKVDDIHGWDFADNDNAPMDVTGHGTHVAGIIAAQLNNGMGIAGVAANVSIMPLRFMDAFDRGTVADAITAIDYAVDHGAQIINCSWGGSGYSSALKQTMAAADALFVCAAGNESANNDTTAFYPANYDLGNSISVAASDQLDQMAWFSNFGIQTVDLAAPGIRIYSLNDSRQVIWEDDFNDGDLGAWTTDGDDPAWSVADPPYSSGTSALASNPSGGYSADINTWVMSPRLDLSEAAGTTVSFYVIGSTQANADYLRLEVSTDRSNWYGRPLLKGSTIAYNGLSGSIPYWLRVTADLGPWDGEAELTLRLRFTSDSSQEDNGYYVDNVTVSAAAQGEAYQYMHGTSMAAAFASGVAALVQSEDLSLLPEQVKAILVRSVDLDYNLYGEVSSSGRINAFNALTLLADLALEATASNGGAVNLSWTGQTPEDATVSVQRRDENQSGFQEVAQVDSGQSNYTDQSANADGIYYYRVQVQTEEGQTGFSPQALVAPTQNQPSSSGGSSGGGGCFLNLVSVNLPF
jgi:subtilisin family serine protease